MTTPRSPIVSLIGAGIGLVLGIAIYYTGDFENITKTAHCESDSDVSESCQVAKQIGDASLMLSKRPKHVLTKQLLF